MKSGRKAAITVERRKGQFGDREGQRTQKGGNGREREGREG